MKQPLVQNICKQANASVLTILNGSQTFEHPKRAYIIYKVANNDIRDAATERQHKRRAPYSLGSATYVMRFNQTHNRQSRSGERGYKHRRCGSRVRLITGHDKPGFTGHDWRSMTEPGSVAAIYMGKKAAYFTQGRLMMH